MTRSAEINRETKETRIRLLLNLDGKGEADASTGIGFFDHMIETLARHGGMNLSIQADGDLRVDEHHTVEDVGICFGEALKKALGDKKGIARFGWAVCPMDEALARVSLDLSGRGFFAGNCPWQSLRVGGLSGETVAEFFKGAASAGGVTLHVDIIRGENGHHMVEAVFKAFAKALGAAAARTGGDGVPSTKGML